MMASKQLEKELCSYCSYVKILRKLFSETKQIFADINSATCFDASNYILSANNGLSFSEEEPNSLTDSSSPKSQDAPSSTSANDWSLVSCDINFKVNTEISSRQEEQLRSLFKSPPTFILLSSSVSRRRKVINTILREDLLNLKDPDQLWRTLHFKYGPRYKSEKIESDSISFHEDDHHFSISKSFNLRSLRKQPTSSMDDILVPPDSTDSKPCYIEVCHNSPLLLAGLQVIVPEVRPQNSAHWHKLFALCATSIRPIFLFVMEGSSFSSEELELIDFLRSQFANLPIMFLKLSADNPDDQSDESFKIRTNQFNPSSSSSEGDDKISTVTQLYSLLNISTEIEPVDSCPIDISFSTSSSSWSSTSELPYQFEMLDDFDTFFDRLHVFVKRNLQKKILSSVDAMMQIHLRCLDSMITLAFNMTRGPVRVPARIKFARMKEAELYSSLMEVAVRKQDEVKKMICETVKLRTDELIHKAAFCELINVEFSNDGTVNSSKDLKACSDQIEDFVLSSLNVHIAGQLVSSVNVLRESFTGILSRCLASLEEMDLDSEGGSSRTSKALREITNTAYQVNITAQTNESILKTFIEKIKQIFHSMLPKSQPKVDSEWKKKVASDMMSSLTESRCQKIAKVICNQIKERVKRSHQMFEASLNQLEHKHSGRIEKTEEHRLKLRKEFAPRVARLSLESRSLKDLILNDKPKVGRMIGNGQYGVVFACDPWKGPGPCAVKILVPPDDKHWNDLAMEFYYTMNIPEHDRIVTLRGSIIDYSYNSNGCGPAVMLVMDRLPMDLFVAIEKKLNWIDRLQVSIDIIEGIRYLHSQGLVHRDIKLKNVLLDENNRGKLTDMGFCKPEALITYSVVGTPIHMAPELVSGKYDHSVDIYAFGVLFWYICSGSVQLPVQFKECPSKEVLWTAVKKGLRPEKPRDIDPECWDLILRCWHGNPNMRPLVGEIEGTLRSIYERVSKSLPPGRKKQTHSIKVYSAFDDASDMSAAGDDDDDDDDDDYVDGVF